MSPVYGETSVDGDLDRMSSNALEYTVPFTPAGRDSGFGLNGGAPLNAVASFVGRASAEGGSTAVGCRTRLPGTLMRYFTPPPWFQSYGIIGGGDEASPSVSSRADFPVGWKGFFSWSATTEEEGFFGIRGGAGGWWGEGVEGWRVQTTLAAVKPESVHWSVIVHQFCQHSHLPCFKLFGGDLTAVHLLREVTVVSRVAVVTYLYPPPVCCICKLAEDVAFATSPGRCRHAVLQVGGSMAKRVSAGAESNGGGEHG